jgi:uncharacterized membrane protein YkoI
LGLSVAVPSFASAAPKHNDHNNARPAARVEHQSASRTQTRVEKRTTTHVERRVEPERKRVVVERRPVVRDIHVDRDVHRDRYRDFHYNRGIRVGVSVTPVYPVYPSYPVYVNNDCDIALNIADVPTCVLNTAGRECGGAIESVRLIRINGVEYYRLIVDSRNGAYEVHVDGAGRLISMGRC